MKYPKDRDVDWKDLAARAHRVLEAKGTDINNRARRYEDGIIEILHMHQISPTYFEVRRKPMPEHPKKHLHRTGNPFYMEHDGACIRVHGEGRYVYQHIIDLDEAL